MAYTLRTTDEDEKILEELKIHTGQGSVSKALLYAAKHFANYEKRMIKAERNLDVVRNFAHLINRLDD